MSQCIINNTIDRFIDINVKLPSPASFPILPFMILISLLKHSSNSLLPHVFTVSSMENLWKIKSNYFIIFYIKNMHIDLLIFGLFWRISGLLSHLAFKSLITIMSPLSEYIEIQRNHFHLNHNIQNFVEICTRMKQKYHFLRQKRVLQNFTHTIPFSSQFIIVIPGFMCDV